ncbi:TldD/PmbA family protein [Pseudomonas tructae]|nr:metallopeptidase TldD-related protein [Pseudomonas tructae]
MHSTFEQMSVGPEDLPLLKQLVQDVLDEARRQGAESCEVLGQHLHQTRQHVAAEVVDPVDIQQVLGLGLACYVDGRKGEVQLEVGEDFSPAKLVSQAMATARAAQLDMYTGPADAQDLAWEHPQLDLFHDWPVDSEVLLGIAQRCDQAAWQTDARVVESRGSTMTGSAQSRVFGNSHGFLAGYCQTEFSLSSYIRAEHNGIRRTGGVQSIQRDLLSLGEAERMGNLAARRAIDYLGDAKLRGTRWPQVLSPQASRFLLVAFIEAIAGEAVSNGASVVSGMLDKPLFSPSISIAEYPLQRGGIGSIPFDNEGVAVSMRTFVEEGFLRSYALDAASARRLGMKNSGNASLPFEQARNLSFVPGPDTQAQLLAQVDRGVFVAEARQPQIDVRQGTFSMRAVGYWVENGEIQYPLSPFTVSGDLLDLFARISVIGNDLEQMSRIKGVSVLIDNLSITH